MMKLEFYEGDDVRVFEEAIETEMKKQLQHFEHELRKVHTGRANPELIEDIKVACYGMTLPIKQLATITAPEPKLLVINAWDKGTISNIEKAITQSDLQLNPQNDGDVIRIPLPPMSQSRREELVKMLNKKLEECKVGIRNVRKNFHNFIRDSEKVKYISEDTAKRLEQILQKMTDSFVKQANNEHENKAQEIQAV